MPTKIEAIRHEVAVYFEVKPRELQGMKRNIWYARPRMVAMYLARKLIVDASYRMIGQWFGNRNHSTVVKNIQKVKQLCAKNGPTRDAVIIIEGRLTRVFEAANAH